MATLDPERLVVVDERGSNLALTPLYARAPRGQRAYAAIPRNYGKNTTLVSALTLSGMDAAMIIEGGVDTAVVEAYVEYVLCPVLTPGKIVVMDNLSSHKGTRVEQLTTAAGCTVLFLPPYSPDFSPIEHAFAKIKQALRRAGARTREALEAALAEALGTITAADARAFFRHCGYAVPA